MRALPFLLLAGCRFGLTAAGPGDSGWVGDAYADDDGLPDTQPGVEDEGGGVSLPDLTGRVYVIAPGGVAFDEPPGVGSLIAQALDRDLLLYVGAHSAGTITFAGALSGTEGGQDPCERVVWFPPAVIQADRFAIGPTDWDVVIAGEEVTFGGFTLEGTFDEAGTRFGGGRMEAELDARQLDDTLPDGMYTCDLLRQIGSACHACNDGYVGCFTLGGVVEATREVLPFDPEPEAGACP